MNVIKILRFFALILGLLASVIFIVFLMGEGGYDLIQGKIRVIPIMLMMLFSVAGFFWAVTNPSRGSLIMISGGLIMMTYLLILGGIGEISMALIFGLPFIIPGILFNYISKKRSRT